MNHMLDEEQVSISRLNISLRKVELLQYLEIFPREYLTWTIYHLQLAGSYCFHKLLNKMLR